MRQHVEKFGRPRILLVGCGDVGLRLLPLLAPRYRVFALTRQGLHSPAAAAIRAAGGIPIYGDLDQPRTLQRLRGLASTCIHLAPPPNQGNDDPRTQHLLSILSRGLKTASNPTRQTLLYISTSGVYGDCAGAWIDETRPLHPESARAARRVAAERRVRAFGKPQRQHPAHATQTRQVSILRVPGIYAAERLPLARLQAGTPALCDADDVYTNHIHADDLAHICRAALWHGRPQRVYHASDDSEMKMGAYFDAVAQAFGLAAAPRLPRDQLAQVVNPNLLSFMRESRRLKNTRLKTELGYRLRYPTVQAFLQAPHGR
ncbi:NAD-dependent epimerase/dehydratase family protein [Parvibium lacunae]|uniref:SDR family NAD(P)-dependent oxidoreductase n=1 Tax=Parvibium lacunae TaxID=1888893 RepID=A0A368L7G9_9BURK|nr:NAD-dependent epimerase/dehydratase family protein [Parvibium lacunae]RCS59189.1 SDR family NAD(P)-dependent oxidoreductase [Parvibium lacunae]